MSGQEHKQGLGRRSVLQGAAGLAGASILSGSLASEASAQSATTLVIAVSTDPTESRQ